MTTFLLLAIAAVYIWVAVPLARRRVPPNRTYGIRTAATRADDRVWYDANAAGGRDLMVLSAVFALCAFALPNTDWGFGMAMALLVIGTLAMAAAGTVRANRMLEERQAEDRALRHAEHDADGAHADEVHDEATPAPRRRRRTR